MIGNLNISSLTEKSGDLIFQFYENKTERHHDNIFLIGLPQKGKFSFLIAVDILTRLLKDDLTKTKVSGHLRSLNTGDKIIFFESKRAEFVSFNKTSITFNSKYYGSEPYRTTETQRLSILYGSTIKKYTGNAKTLHTIKDILSKALERRESTTARDKLLLTDQFTKKLGVPSGLLKSKVMLITGNGSKKKFTKWADEIEIYEESIASLFKENLIIEKDLSKFKDFFSSDSKSERLSYNKVAISILYNLADDFSDFEDEILELIFDFEKGDYNEDDVLKLKDDIKALYGRSEEDLNMLVDRIPKFSSPLPSGVKMVIIDSFDTVEKYQNVIKGLADLKIKVVYTYDLNDFSEINPFPESPKYFWTRDKLRSVLQSENSEEKIDGKLFDSAFNFSRQNFSVFVYNDVYGLSELFWKIYSEIKEVEGEENIVKLFWQSLHPIYYVIKNSPNINNDTKSRLLDSLEHGLKAISTEESEIESLFERFIVKARTYINTKTLDNGNVYSQPIIIDSEEILIPQLRNTENLTLIKNPNSDHDDITFPGIPYKEYHLKSIENLVRSCSIPNLKFLCFEKEYAYLLKTINNVENSKWLQDNNIQELLRESDCPIAGNESNILNVDKSYEFSKELNSDIEDFKHFSQSYTAFYHSRYKGSYGTYTKNSFTVHLKSDKWIYIPNNDKIYFIDTANNTISQKKGSELNKSDIIILFDISKRDLRIIGSSNENIDNLFNDLEIWSNALTELFEKCNKNYDKLEEKLIKFKNDERKKANPNRINLMRWLNDNDLTLAPRKDNLEIILDAAGLLNKKQKVLNASKTISQYEKKFKKNIKIEISNNSNDFITKEDEIIKKELFVNGVSVVVTACKVTSIDNEILDIDNIYVKKII